VVVVVDPTISQTISRRFYPHFSSSSFSLTFLLCHCNHKISKLIKEKHPAREQTREEKKKKGLKSKQKISPESAEHTMRSLRRGNTKPRTSSMSSKEMDEKPGKLGT
jgi:hypothetical protein